MADNFPILVDRYQGNQGRTVICTLCLAEKVVGDIGDVIGEEGEGACPVGCGGDTVFKYVEADRCPSCGKLGFWDRALDRCCSRKCMLQAEYARTLNG
jgi:hypothetical protein